MKRRILFRFEANSLLGMGHWFRIKTLSNVFSECFWMYCMSKESADFIGIANEINVAIANSDNEIIDLIEKYEINCVVNDILNTSKEYMNLLRKVDGLRIINLEDEGEGANYADAVINELYERSDAPINYYYGHKYCCLDSNIINYERKAFSDLCTKIVVLFGCSDPCNLSLKTIESMNSLEVDHAVSVDVIIGPGNYRIEQLREWIHLNYKNKRIKINLIEEADIREYISHADIGISSQGRTIFELAYFNVPSVIMAQNERERLHTFACSENGFVNLGLGIDVVTSELTQKIKDLIENTSKRKQLYIRMRSLEMNNGLEEVKKLILL